MSRAPAPHVLLASLVVGLASSLLVRIGWAAAVALVPGAALLPAAAALARPRLLAGALVFALAGLAWGSWRLEQLGRSALRADIGRAGVLVAVTTSEARAGQFDQHQFAVVESFEGRHPDERVELQLPRGRAPPEGARIELLAELREPPSSQTGFDRRTWLRRQGVHVELHVDRWAVIGRRGGVAGAGDALRRFLRRASTPGLSGERRAVLNGILLGDDTGLSPGLKKAFRRSGLYHLLAVSGQNVVLLAGGVLGLAWLLGLPRRIGHVAALCGIAAYVLAVGPQPSVVRAAVAGGAVSVAWLLGRERDRWHLVLLAATVLLAWTPYSLLDAGFQLSFAAVVAIFLAATRVREVLEGYPMPPLVRAPVAVAAACSVATAPILWLQFDQVPLYGIVANALVEVAVAPLLALAFAAAVVDPVAPRLAEVLAGVNGWLAAYVVACARAVAAIPGAQATGEGAALAVSGALVAAAYAWRRWRTTSSRFI